MKFLQLPCKLQTTSYRFTNIILISSSFCLIYLITWQIFASSSSSPDTLISIPPLKAAEDFEVPAMTLQHIVFGIASNQRSWQNRKEYVKIWWKAEEMRGCVFLEGVPVATNDSSFVPPICISEDTSRFQYTYRGGLRSAIRVARVVKETISLNCTDVRWFVFGDDDTIFFPENLVKTLSKYDHGLWYYIGANSEIIGQNKLFSFDMAFGGAGFAISYSLAKVLSKVFDSCIERYPHLYGSDSRIYSCLVELGVGLTHEPGFHQLDIRGDIFGLLASHPITPLISLHHLDHTNPIFPNMTSKHALTHLFKSYNTDPQRILQHTVCYDRRLSWTISVSWGYSVQIFEQNLNLADVIVTQETFTPWKLNGEYGFTTRQVDPNHCKRPTILFFDHVNNSGDGIMKTTYKRNITRDCAFHKNSPKKIKEVRVFSEKLELNVKQLQAPRRHCCDVLQSSKGKVMELAIRECKEEELIYMI